MTDQTLRLLVSMARELTLRGMVDDPKPGDLVVEVTHRGHSDPDAIGWLLGEGHATWGADDPPGSPTRHVWDIKPLNPDAKLHEVGGVLCQRWENALFYKVDDSILRRAGVLADLAVIEGRA